MSGFGDPGGQPPGGFGQPPNWGQPPSSGFGQPPGGFGQPPGGGFGPPGYGQGGYGAPNAIVPYQNGYQAPSAADGEAKLVGVMMLVSGIMNIIHALSLFIGLIFICVGVAWIFPLVVAIFEIVVAASIMGGKPSSNAKTVSILGLIAAILNLNIIGIVCQIVAMTVMSKPGVSERVMGVRAY